MLIIIEGADCVGKTTLRDRITTMAQHKGLRVTHLAAGPPDPLKPILDQYEGTLLTHREAIMSFGDLVICDRWHLGELVYGPMLRQQSALTAEGFQHVELLLDALGAVRVIVTTATPGELEDRFRRRGDKLVTLDQALAANRWFVYWYTSHRADEPQRWCLTHTPSGFNLVNELLDKAELNTTRVEQLRPFPGYVGPPSPNTLLVGDAPNGWKPGDPVRPAFIPVKGNSSAYLLSALRLFPGVHDTGLSNSADVDLERLWVGLGWPKLVALGTLAAQRLEELGLDHAWEPHPQYWRRFHNGRLKDYASKLRQQPVITPSIDNEAGAQ